MKFWRTARTLERLRPFVKGARAKGAGLPPVFFVTDPDRVSDPLAIARRLPRGTGIVFRGFGQNGSEEIAKALGNLAKARGLVFLVGADATLAFNVGAAGVHLPEREMGRIRRLRARHPQWIITVAAHSPLALARARTNGVDAAFYSAIFPSLSASAGSPMGPIRLALASKAVDLPIFALGGVNASTAARLIGTGAAGFAAVEAFEP